MSEDMLKLFFKGGANVNITLSLHEIRELVAEVAEQAAQRVITAQLAASESLLTGDEVCRILGVSSQTLWRWGKMGYMPQVRVGGRIRYKRKDVETIKASRSS